MTFLIEMEISASQSRFPVSGPAGPVRDSLARGHDVRAWGGLDRSREIMDTIYLDLPGQPVGVGSASGFSLSTTFQGSSLSMRLILWSAIE
jgi:hypothetical protein